jgi:starvation-inducible DNA-binding protein
MSPTRIASRTNGKLNAFRTQIDLAPDVRQQMIALLNQQVADTFDLFSQTKQAHWNVRGPDFYQLHELFDELAAGLAKHVDELAERATALGGLVKGTVRMAAGTTRLLELPLDSTGSMQTVSAMVERYASVAASTREAISKAEQADDQGTMDLLTEISRDVDKSLWFLEAHLQGQP